MLAALLSRPSRVTLECGSWQQNLHLLGLEKRHVKNRNEQFMYYYMILHAHERMRKHIHIIVHHFILWYILCQFHGSCRYICYPGTMSCPLRMQIQIQSSSIGRQRHKSVPQTLKQFNYTFVCPKTKGAHRQQFSRPTWNFWCAHLDITVFTL
jgi:hypothetical protein